MNARAIRAKAGDILSLKTAGRRCRFAAESLLIGGFYVMRICVLFRFV